jgi:methylmalonyl-CoA mutase
MPSDIDDLPLAREFPSATHDDWEKLVDGVLKGAAFEKLVSKTYDGLRIEPIYRGSKDAEVVAGRPAAAPWQIMQRVDHPDAAAANTQALTDLENGATGLSLVLTGANGAHGFGLEPTAAALECALDGIHLDAGIGIEFQIGPQTRDMPQHFADLLAKRKIRLADVAARFGFDPIGAAAVWGNSPYAWADVAKFFGPSVAKFATLGFKGPYAVADGRVIHDAGGSEAQELAFVLAVAVAYLRAIEDAGVGLDEARRMIYARLSADADQFMTLAKFRALRLLWAHVEHGCGLQPHPLFVAADTAWRMLTRRDPYVNLLRATVATFAAGLGGANSMTVLPHTMALGLPDPFARRIARNIQLILLEESNLDKVTDPAAGSGGIESLTAELAQAAWSLFQAIEKAGGAFAALQHNLIQDQVASVRAARDKNIARRKDILTGASEFPNLHEAPVAVLDATPVALAPYGEAKIKFAALAPFRLAEPFERLRDRSDAILATRGTRPRIFLANLGTHADFAARATFAKSFFEAGGIEAIDSDGGSDPAGIVTAFKASGATLVCLCSSDKVYAGLAADTAKALQATGATHIYLAGRPGELEASLRAAGIAEFVFAGCDAVATLTTAYATMGMS